ncbi:MFS transporter [Xanthomonas hortorum pv. pelargonii]|nr:MFS transporter [Xanthomonas hortorum pv. pelargonii]
MSAPATARASAQWGLLLIASAMLMLTMGARQTTGLFVEPIHRQTGIGIASISFALAVGQLVWGAVQPVFGAIADERGPLPVLLFGGVLLSLGLGLSPWMASEWGLIVSLGILAAAGAGAGSFSVLIGATAGRIAPERRSFAAGLINAGGSLGQFVFAPLVQLMIGAAGWARAMTGLAVISLLTLPLAWPLRRRSSPPGTRSTVANDDIGLRAQLRLAVRDRSYWCLHLGFLPAGYTSRFWSRTCPAKSHCAVCLPACLQHRSH